MKSMPPPVRQPGPRDIKNNTAASLTRRPHPPPRQRTSAQNWNKPPGTPSTSVKNRKISSGNPGASAQNRKISSGNPNASAKSRTAPPATPHAPLPTGTVRRRRISFRIIFSLILIGLGGIGSALTYAVIYDVQVKITQTTRAYNAQREENAALRAQLGERYSLAEVERIAREELNMSEPDASQIIHIQVPKESYVVLNDGDEVTEDTENYFWEGLASYISDLFNRLMGGEYE
jgi:cell division protein FtsB